MTRTVSWYWYNHFKPGEFLQSAKLLKRVGIPGRAFLVFLKWAVADKVFATLQWALEERLEVTFFKFFRCPLCTTVSLRLDDLLRFILRPFAPGRVTEISLSIASESGILRGFEDKLPKCPVATLLQTFFCLVHGRQGFFCVFRNTLTFV